MAHLIIYFRDLCCTNACLNLFIVVTSDVKHIEKVDVFLLSCFVSVTYMLFLVFYLLMASISKEQS